MEVATAPVSMDGEDMTMMDYEMDIDLTVEDEDIPEEAMNIVQQPGLPTPLDPI